MNINRFNIREFDDPNAVRVPPIGRSGEVGDGGLLVLLDSIDK